MKNCSEVQQPPRYQTFLVTCWQQKDAFAKRASWRFRLETLRSGQYRIFATLEEVISTIELELSQEE